MPSYHINPETGNANICKAVKKCQFTTEDGITPLHYETKDEAQKAIEKELSKTHEKHKTIKKSKTRKIETLNESKNLELTNRMIEEHDEMIKHLDNKEQNSLSYYSFSGSSAMNRVLHGTTRDYETEDSIKKDKEHIQRIDRIINRFGNNGETRTLYRYISLDKKSDINEYLKDNFEEGNKYTDTGFMSTTEDPAFIAAYAKKHSRDRNFLILEIETDKGISMQNKQESIGNIQTFEKERLLPRDMKFKVEEKFKAKAKIDESRQKLMEQFNGSYFTNWSTGEKEANPIPTKTFQIIKMIDEDLVIE